jgi:hypothetical protein
MCIDNPKPKWADRKRPFVDPGLIDASAGNGFGDPL